MPKRFKAEASIGETSTAPRLWAQGKPESSYVPRPRSNRAKHAELHGRPACQQFHCLEIPILALASPHWCQPCLVKSYSYRVSYLFCMLLIHIETMDGACHRRLVCFCRCVGRRCHVCYCYLINYYQFVLCHGWKLQQSYTLLRHTSRGKRRTRKSMSRNHAGTAAAVAGGSTAHDRQQSSVSSPCRRLLFLRLARSTALVQSPAALRCAILLARSFHLKPPYTEPKPSYLMIGALDTELDLDTSRPNLQLQPKPEVCQADPARSTSDWGPLEYGFGV